jgi:hypothetical protein
MDSLPETSIEGVEGRSAEQASLRSSSRDSSGITEYDDHKAETTGDEPCEHTEPETTDAEVNPDSETCRYMERLVRTHLEDVMEPYRNAHIPLSDPLFQYGPQDLFSRLATAYAKGNDIMLAHLLKAVISVYCTARSGLTEPIENLFRHIHQLLVPLRKSGLDKTTTLLYIVIERLARFEADGNLRSTEHESDSTAVSSIIVSVSDDTKEIAFEDILPYFWSSRLETDCYHCHQPFEDEPPIRTIAQENSVDQMSSSKLHVKVFSRHFACVQASGTFMVPVSHVWDDSIRTANASKTHNDDAAWTMLRTIEALFKGAQDAFEPEVEFWHDYFSVPQWEPKIKETLLLYLPAIYHSSGEVLIHMSDLPTRSVRQLLSSEGLKNGPSIKQAVERIPPLADLAKSQWMQRMWVILEYSQANSTSVMDQSNTIWRYKKDASGAIWNDSFTLLVNIGMLQLEKIFWCTGTLLVHIRSGGFARMLPTRRSSQRSQLCLGEVMELLSTKQCQIFRDRFIAIHTILNKNHSPKDPPDIPEKDTDACSWVWRSALSKADYSPLLLQPRECVSSSNPESPLPSWLVGSRSVDQAEWGLGSQNTAPMRTLSVTEVSVKAVLNQVGQIRAIHYMDMHVAGQIEGVNQMIRILVAIAQTAGFVLSPENLYDAIDNVFPFPNTVKDKIREEVIEFNMVFSFNERRIQDPKFSAKLLEHLDLYIKMSEEGKTAQVLEAARSITTLLQLDLYVPEIFTRLDYSKSIALARKERDAVKGEPLYEVRCPQCHKTTILRLDLRETGNVGDIVYQIPGLSYTLTGDCVGLVLRDGRITGRMLYGKPACNCRLQKIVEIL